MMRITQSSPGDGPLCLRVEGRILARTVEALLEACDRAAGESPPVLDVSQVAFVDAAGIEALRALSRRGARLHGCSPFLAELLRSVDANETSR